MAECRTVFLGMNATGHAIVEWLRAEGEAIVATVTRADELKAIEAYQTDVVVSAGFRHGVPARYLEVPPLGRINLHKSLLPYNRGANPNVWTIIDGTPAGVSSHYMDSGLDTGPILAQRRVAADFADSGKSLYDKIHAAPIELFHWFWPRFKHGELEARPQAGEGTYQTTQDFKRGVSSTRTTLSQRASCWTISAR